MATSYAHLPWALAYIMALCFEMDQLPWFKANWKKTFSQPRNLLHDKYVLLMVKLIYCHINRLLEEQR